MKTVTTRRRASTAWRLRTTAAASASACVMIACSEPPLMPRAVAQSWQPVPLRTAASKAAGNAGGEGCQWPQALAVAPSGSFLLYGTDVGGIFRSTDGGANWEPCNVRFNARGACGLAIDPNNPARCIAIGANSTTADYHGLYVSVDGAASWAQRVSRPDAGYRDLRDQVAYDASSKGAFDHSRVAYWSSKSGGLYKTTDGGATWAVVNAGFGDGHVKVNPRNGTVYVGNATAFFRSTNGGTSFSRTLTGAVLGLDAVGDSVYVSKTGGVWRSANSGGTFARLGTSGLPTTIPLRSVRVSPADPARILVVGDHGEYDKRIYVTTNGGSTWSLASYDNSQSFVPFNGRTQLFAWHPSQSATAWSFGGDWITKSIDSGRTFVWANNGNNGVLVGGMWNFSHSDPNLVFFGSQDYNGAVTSDGGDTWRYCNVSGQPWGGFCYGGYAQRYADTGETVCWTGNSAGWGGTRTLRLSRDGGVTWFDAGGANTWGNTASNGQDVSLTDPAAFWVSFAGDLRSADRGWNWSRMSGCDGVFTSSAGADKALFGIKVRGKNASGAPNSVDIVRSTDHGATWTVLGNRAERVRDLAYDHVRGRLYVVGEWELHYLQNGAWTTVATSPDQTGGRSVRTVAVDPANPSIVYVGSARDWMKTDVGVQRSLDAGATWATVTARSALSSTVKDGGNEAICVRVHPVTRFLWASTSCYGVWKLPPP